MREYTESTSPKPSLSSMATTEDTTTEHLTKKRKISPPPPGKLISGPLPLLRNRSTSPRKSQKATLEDTATSKGLARPSRSEVPPVTRKPTNGTRFRSLQHMNNARKKSAQELPVDPNDPNLKTVSFFSQAPVASPLDDESMFFPENTEEQSRTQPAGGNQTLMKQDSPKENSTPIPLTMTKKLLTTPKASQSTSTITTTTDSVPAPPAVNNAVNGRNASPDTPVAAPPVSNEVPPTQAIAPGHRTWAKHELVVYVSLGQHPVGDLKIANIDGYLRTQLMALKQTVRSFVIPLAFEQQLVLKAAEVQRSPTVWSNTHPRCYPTNPFEDTAPIYLEFAQYLERNDLTAVWEHPTSDMLLLLFAPTSYTWKQMGRYKDTPANPGLVIETRQRQSGPQRLPAMPPQPASRGTIVCRHWRAGHCWRNDDCHFAHTLEVASPTARRVSMSAANPDRSRHQAEDSSPLRLDASPTGDRLALFRSQSTAAVEPVQKTASAAGTEPTPDSRIKRKRRASVHESAFTKAADVAPTVPNEQKSASDPSQHRVDWTFTADYRALIKLIKKQAIVDSKMPRILIAFPEENLIQCDALQAWALQHTSSRCVFAARDWKELLQISRPNDPNIFFFREGYPIFTQLESFYEFLHRDEVVCHSVSWEITAGTQKAKYRVKPLFPRRTLMLITEDVLLLKPAIASYILEWFIVTYNTRNATGKLMIRPGVQNFLESRAQALAAANNKEETQDTLKLLISVRDLLPTMDVTVPGTTSLLSDFLGNEDVVRSSSFLAFPHLPEYDHQPTASTDEAEVAKRDHFLIHYFRTLSVAEADQFGRFLVLHNGKAAQTADTQHISFRSVATFVEGLKDRKSKGDEAKT